MGNRVLLNYNCCVLDVCRVDIGDCTVIGPNVQIYAADHPRERELREGEWEFGKPIRIGKNVWIGGGATILPGVTVGDSAIIGWLIKHLINWFISKLEIRPLGMVALTPLLLRAGAVVTRDVPGGATVAGIPARQTQQRK